MGVKLGRKYKGVDGGKVCGAAYKGSEEEPRMKADKG